MRYTFSEGPPKRSSALYRAALGRVLRGTAACTRRGPPRGQLYALFSFRAVAIHTPPPLSGVGAVGQASSQQGGRPHRTAPTWTNRRDRTVMRRPESGYTRDRPGMVIWELAPSRYITRGTSICRPLLQKENWSKSRTKHTIRMSTLCALS